MAALLASQCGVVVGVLVTMLVQGVMLSYPSCLLPALLDGSASIRTDLATASWIASSVGLSSLAGFLASSYLMERYGRRAAFALALLPSAAGWLLLYCAGDVGSLLAGRALTGVSGGATVTLGAIVLGEYTSPESRGMFLNLKSAAVCVGNMAVHVLNNYMDWRNIALVALFPCVIAFGIVCSWEESPSWLASKGYYDKSEEVFYSLRGKSEKSYREFTDLLKSQKEQAARPMHRNVNKFKQLYNNLTEKKFLKPLMIVGVSGVLSECSGRHIFPAYASQIIGDITGDKTQSFYYTLSIDLIITSSITFSSVLVRVMKRRVLLFSTGFLSLFVLISVCTYLYLTPREVSSEKSWIPLSMFVLYFVLANLCCTPFPFIIIGEIFPLVYKGAGAAVTGIFLSLYLMIALKITPYMLIGLSVYGTFAVFGVVVMVCLVTLYFILPETKDRTLPEIETYFNSGKFGTIDDESVSRKMIY